MYRTKLKHALASVRLAVHQAPFSKVLKDVPLLIKGRNMESILPQLLAFPPHPPPTTPLPDAEFDKQIKVTIHLLSTIAASKLTSGVLGGGDLLDVPIVPLEVRIILLTLLQDHRPFNQHTSISLRITRAYHRLRGQAKGW